MTGNVREIPLSNGTVAIVDEEDYGFLNQWRWTYRNNGGKQNYAVRQAGGRKNRTTIYMHALVAGSSSGQIVDHVDGNGLNNRRSNLRVCDQSRNSANSRKRTGTTSRFKGVCRSIRNGKWQSHVTFQGKCHCLGEFVLEEDAAIAYNKKAAALFGEFALLNDVHPRDVR